LRKENSQKEQTQSLQSISFDGEERQRLARQDREIYMPGIETRRATVMPNSIPISNLQWRFEIGIELGMTFARRVSIPGI
jgi:hypothetical protein